MITLKLNKIFIVGNDVLYVNKIVHNLKEEGFLEIEIFASQNDFLKSIKGHYNVCVIMQTDALSLEECEGIRSLQEVAYLVAISSKLPMESVSQLRKYAFGGLFGTIKV